MVGSPLIYTGTRGAGTTLVRNAVLHGTNFQLNTGHGFYRPHTHPSGAVTDLRTTGLTPDIIETEITHHILTFLASGGWLPQPGPGFTGPLQRHITVSGCQIGYRAVRLNPATISVSTYFLLP